MPRSRAARANAAATGCVGAGRETGMGPASPWRGSDPKSRSRSRRIIAERTTSGVHSGARAPHRATSAAVGRRKYPPLVVVEPPAIRPRITV